MNNDIVKNTIHVQQKLYTFYESTNVTWGQNQRRDKKQTHSNLIKVFQFF